MARIPDQELERLKREASLARLIEGRSHPMSQAGPKEVSQGKLRQAQSFAVPIAAGSARKRPRIKRCSIGLGRSEGPSTKTDSGNEVELRRRNGRVSEAHRSFAQVFVTRLPADDRPRKARQPDRKHLLPIGTCMSIATLTVRTAREVVDRQRLAPLWPFDRALQRRILTRAGACIASPEKLANPLASGTAD
jgi:hypothetical protein